MLHVKGHTECSRLVSVIKHRTRSKRINVTCKRTYRMFSTSQCDEASKN